MRVDVSPRRKNAPRPAEKSAPAFLQWLRGRQCLATGCGEIYCAGKIEAAHVDYAGGKGMGTKVADKHAVPLCSEHHRLQHSRGWPWFDFTILGMAGGGAKAADRFWQQWPGRIAWERKQEGGQ